MFLFIFTDIMGKDFITNTINNRYRKKDCAFPKLYEFGRMLQISGTSKK